MNERFLSYLRSLGLTAVLTERIEDVFKFYEEICPEEIKDIFVTDLIRDDGSREFVNLWFFSKTFAMEAKEFATKDDFDMGPIQGAVQIWGIEKTDYDFRRATAKSRLYLKVNADTHFSCYLNASMANCDSLKDILIKYIMPNFVR